MDTWQAWAAAAFGFAITLLSGDRMLEKRRVDSRNKYLYDKIDALTKEQHELSTRATKIEANAITEKEVRAIMTELIKPMSETMVKLNENSEKITEQITSIRITLAKGNKDEDSGI